MVTINTNMYHQTRPNDVAAVTINTNMNHRSRLDDVAAVTINTNMNHRLRPDEKYHAMTVLIILLGLWMFIADNFQLLQT